MASGTDSSIETNSTELNVPLRNIQNTQEFMEEIQKYPVLYDKFSKVFKDKCKKHNVCMSVVSTFSTTPQEVEKRHKSIRMSYGRYLRWLKTMPTGSERKAVPNVTEFEHLDWLKIYIEQTNNNKSATSKSKFRSK